MIAHHFSSVVIFIYFQMGNSGEMCVVPHRVVPHGLLLTGIYDGGTLGLILIVYPYVLIIEITTINIRMYIP